MCGDWLQVVLFGLLERSRVPARVPSTILQAWPVLHARIHALFTIIEPAWVYNTVSTSVLYSIKVTFAEKVAIKKRKSSKRSHDTLIKNLFGHRFTIYFTTFCYEGDINLNTQVGQLTRNYNKIYRHQIIPNLKTCCHMALSFP